MKEKTKQIAKATGKHALNYGAGGGGAYGLLLLAERFGWRLSPEEAIALTAAALWGWHRLRPLAKALYGKLLAWAGVAAFVLTFLPGSAGASPARVVLDCAESVEVLRGDTNEIEEECTDPTWFFDAGIKFDGIVLRLNRPRDLLVGFSTGLGYGLRFSPEWWTYTAAFLALDLFAGGGFEAGLEGQDGAVSINGLAVLTFINWIGAGFGVQHAFGLGARSDVTDVLGTFGVSTSF